MSKDNRAPHGALERQLELWTQRYIERSTRELERNISQRFVDMKHDWQREIISALSQNAINSLRQSPGPDSLKSKEPNLNTSQVLSIIAHCIQRVMKRNL